MARLTVLSLWHAYYDTKRAATLSVNPQSRTIYGGHHIGRLTESESTYTIAMDAADRQTRSSFTTTKATLTRAHVAPH